MFGIRVPINIRLQSVICLLEELDVWAGLDQNNCFWVSCTERDSGSTENCSEGKKVQLGMRLVLLVHFLLRRSAFG